MKIRSGFVSNSSSSSFCILGISFDSEDQIPETWSKHPSIKFEEACNEYDDRIFLGMYPENMKDEETLLQFKERIAQALTEGGIPTKSEDLHWFTDGGYNG